MILTNLLDDLGIHSNNDDKDGPNLIQGQELMKYERNYNAVMEAKMNLLASGSAPILGFVNEGFEPTQKKCDTSVLINTTLTSKITAAHISLEEYEKASSKYKKSLKDIKLGEPIYFNSVLVNTGDKHVKKIKVYDEQLEDYITKYTNQAGSDENWEAQCVNIVSDFNIKKNSWGDATNLVPIQDLFNNKCRTKGGSILNSAGLEKLIPDPLDSGKESLSNSNMCPRSHPKAFSGAEGAVKKYCCSSGVYNEQCYGEKKKFSYINGVAEDHKLTIQKGSSGTVYTLALQPWNGFAIGADAGATKGKDDNGFIPVGINRIYGGNYSIFWANTTTTDLSEDDCPNDFVFMTGMRQATMIGKMDNYNSDEWTPSFVDNDMVSGFFYISANEKTLFANELVGILRQIVEVDRLLAIYHNWGAQGEGEMTPVDLLDPLGQGGDGIIYYIKGDPEEYINPNWIDLKPIYNEAEEETKYKQSGLCISQFGAYFNKTPKLNINITSPGDGLDAQTNPSNYNAVGHSLQQGNLCGWNCIKGCPSWDSYGLSKDNKLYQKCSNNQCRAENFADPKDFTIALIVSIQNHARQSRGGRKGGNLSFDSQSELNSLSTKPQCRYDGKPQSGYIPGAVTDEYGNVEQYLTLADAKIACDIAGNGCAGITYSGTDSAGNADNQKNYTLRKGSHDTAISLKPTDTGTGEQSWFKKTGTCIKPDPRYKENTLETCQDLRNAYNIYSLQTTSKGGMDGRVFREGCAPDDILAIYKKNCSPNKTQLMVGPDPKKSRVKSRCPKILPFESHMFGAGGPGGGGGGGGGEGGGGGGGGGGGNIPQWKKVSTVEYYPKRVFINAFGYRQSFNKKIKTLAEPLKKLQERCPSKRPAPKTMKGRYMPSDKACFGPDVAKLFGSSDENNQNSIPTLDSVSQLTGEFDKIFSNCQTGDTDVVGIEMVNDSVYKKQGKTGDESLGKTNLDDLLLLNDRMCRTQVIRGSNNIPIVGQIVKTISGSGKTTTYYWIDLEGRAVDVTSQIKTNPDVMKRCSTFPALVDGAGDSTNLETKIANILKQAPEMPATELEKFPRRQSITTEEICAAYDRSLYDEVQTAATKLTQAVAAVAAVITRVESQNDICKKTREAVETHLADIVIKVNNDMDKLDHLELVQDTDIAREESTSLIKNSTKLQYMIWSIIGIGLLIYGMFGISTVSYKSPFHIVMLVACVIILFIILRRFYLSGII